MAPKKGTILLFSATACNRQYYQPYTEEVLWSRKTQLKAPSTQLFKPNLTFIIEFAWKGAVLGESWVVKSRRSENFWFGWAELRKLKILSLIVLKV
jgi:hypothetical protein